MKTKRQTVFSKFMYTDSTPFAKHGPFSASSKNSLNKINRIAVCSNIISTAMNQ